MKQRSRAAVWLVVVVAGWAVSISRAQQSKTVWAGIYTEAQAVAGETLYVDHCAKCHGEELAGIEQAPALVGSTFAQKWHRATVQKLFERVEAMPPTAPKSLTAKQYADVLAFLLSANEFPAGETPLVADRSALTEITITSAPPR